MLEDRIALHSWTLDSTPLEDFLRIARDAGYAGVELRHVDFRRCLARGRTLDEVIDAVWSSGIRVAVMGVAGGVLFARGEERERLLASFEETCRTAAALGCPMLMISPGQNPHSTIDYAALQLRCAGEMARDHGLKLALEFNSRHPVINSLDVARDLLARAGLPNCGLLLDAYHLHCSGAPGRGFAEVPGAEIFAFQFSDAPPGPPSAVRSPTDRLPPGQGVVRWSEVFGLLMEKGYAGYIDYEAPNPAQWSRPPEEVAVEGIEATRRLLTAARAARGGQGT